MSLQSLDILRYNHRLFPIAVGRFQLQFLTMLILREHILRNLPFVTPDKRISRLHNQLRRTIVLLQFKELRVIVLALEVQDIVDIGPSERIDTLRIIAYYTHLLALFRQLVNDGLLRKVRILILIYEYKMKLIHILLPYLLMVLKQNPRLNQQIIEVHRVGLTAPLHIPYIYIRDLRAFLTGIISGPGTLRISLRKQQVVLRHGDSVGYG